MEQSLESERADHSMTRKTISSCTFCSNPALTQNLESKNEHVSAAHAINRLQSKINFLQNSPSVCCKMYLGVDTFLQKIFAHLLHKILALNKNEVCCYQDI